MKDEEQQLNEKEISTKRNLKKNYYSTARKKNGKKPKKENITKEKKIQIISKI